MSGGQRKTLTTGGTEVAQGITGETCVRRVLESGLFAAVVAGTTVTEASPGADAAVDVAITVAIVWFGTKAGAVYSPVASMLPPPVTVQVTL